MQAYSNALYPKDRAVVQLPQLVSRLLSADVRIPAFYRQDEGRALSPEAEGCCYCHNDIASPQSYKSALVSV